MFAVFDAARLVMGIICLGTFFKILFLELSMRIVNTRIFVFNFQVKNKMSSFNMSILRSRYDRREWINTR